MKVNALVSTVTRSFNRVGFKIKKHSPEILVVAGVTGVVTSAVMACKATTKVSDVLADAKDQINIVHNTLDDENISEERYSHEDGKKDLAIIYTQTAVKLVKLYGPSVVIGAASIASILASNNILRKRNVAIAAAYATVDKTFKDYRGRVVERFGEKLDKELRYGIKAEQVDEITVDENGKEKVKKKTVEVATGIPSQYSDFARIFDESCKGWTKDPEFNLMFLRRQQDYANELLQKRGHLFLNEVYELLGFPHTKAAAVAGWTYDKKRPKGDNYVDFGIYDIYTVSEQQAERRAAFVNGYERSVILDFNIDGNILDSL